jgi:hypothetical protein
VPIDVDRTHDIARTVSAIYREGETALLAAITARLRAGHDRGTDWQAGRLAVIGTLRQAAERIATALSWSGSAAVRRAVAAGYRSGSADAVRDLAAWLSPSTRSPARAVAPAIRTGQLAVQALAEATVRELAPLHAAILPQTLGVYRQAVTGATARRLTGAANTREAAQAAYARLVAHGITGYDDTAGRRWRLHTYVDMSVRTAVLRAAVHGNVDELRAGGVEYVSVDDLPGECWRCRPYEHRVLALDPGTPPGVRRVRHWRRSWELVEIHVVATLDQAMAAGLFHPNCRHSLRPYYPGVSMLIKQGRTADPEGERARQRQREIERHLRHWRDQEAAALTDAGRQRAAARVAMWDAEMAAHVHAHRLTRQRYREQIGAGIIPPPERADDLVALLGTAGNYLLSQ